MELPNKIRKLLSLSAASVAFLQGAVTAPANIPPVVVDRKSVIKEFPTVSTEKLVLTPSSTSETIQLARGHSSHSSHSSHRSHSSHYSGGSGGYVAPVVVRTPIYSSPAPTVSGVTSTPTVRSSAPVVTRDMYSGGLPGLADTNSGAVGGPTNIVMPVAGISATNTNQAPVVVDELTAKIVEFQKKQAAAGSASAQYSLGVRYLNGDGVAQDVDKGKTLLEMSAEQGDPRAKEKLKKLGLSK